MSKSSHVTQERPSIHAARAQQGSSRVLPMTPEAQERQALGQALQLKRDAQNAQLMPGGMPQRQNTLPRKDSPQGLPQELKSNMEGALNTDLSAVRVHANSEHAQQMGAHAYTQGEDVYFAPGQYDPQSQGGKELIGHELTHVKQQREGRVQATRQMKGVGVNENRGLEKEADEMGKQAAAHTAVAADHTLASPATQHQQATMSSQGQPIQRERAIEVINYDTVATEIHDVLALKVPDATKIDIALAKMDQNPTAVKTLGEVYKSKYKTDLMTDLAAKFAGDDLTYIKRLMADGQTADGNRPPAALDFVKLAAELDTAIDGDKTDVKKVYAILAQTENTPALVDQLKAEYKKKAGTDLTTDLAAAMKGDALVHATQLIADHSATERINVKSDEEAKKAKEIIKYLKDTHGVEVNSQAGVDAIKATYTNVPKAILDELKTTAWEYRELVALKKSLDFFAPIMGAKRKESTRNGVAQELTTVSKVDQGIDANTATGTLDTTTAGETFKSSKNFSIFTRGNEGVANASIGGPFKDNDEFLLTSATHEMSHAIMEYGLADFMKATKYWTSNTVKTGAADAEEPMTPYGKTSAQEDLAESIKFYFVMPADLLKTCPLRHAYIDKMVKAWKKAP